MDPQAALSVLDEAAAAVAEALGRLDDWGLAGTRAGQYRSDLAADEAALVGRMVLLARDIAEDHEFAEAGYRLVMNCNRHAGQSVWHIHLHLLGGRFLTWPPG